MALFILRRIISLFLVLFLSTIVIFLAVDLLPGDAAQLQLSLNAREDTLASLRNDMGLHSSALQRYWSWIYGFVTGDMGTSVIYRVPVTSMIKARLVVSFPLALMAFLLSVIIGILTGLLAVSAYKSPVDMIVMFVSQVGLAIPNFWFGILLIFFFSITLRWFPSGGFAGWEAGIDTAFQSLILPSLALCLPQAAILARMMRANLLEIMNDPFMRTARAKGLTRNQALRRHAFPNALIPVVTLMGLQFSFLISGAIVIEEVFNLPGLGRLILQSISGRDFPVLQNLVLLLVIMIITVTFLSDLMLGFLDPRLRETVNRNRGAT